MRAGCGGDCLIVRDTGAQPGVEVGDSQLHRPDTLRVRGQRRECAPSRGAAVEAAQAAEGSSTERHAAGRERFRVALPARIPPPKADAVPIRRAAGARCVRGRRKCPAVICFCGQPSSDLRPSTLLALAPGTLRRLAALVSEAVWERGLRVPPWREGRGRPWAAQTSRVKTCSA